MSDLEKAIRPNAYEGSTALGTSNQKIEPTMSDAAKEPVLWRIRDAIRYSGSIIPNLTSDLLPPDEQGRYHQWRETITPQRLNRLSIAHTAIEDGLKYLIKSTGSPYSRTHDLRALLDELRTCDSDTAESLDNAFAAATGFYGTDTLDPDYRHLASLQDYLETTGNNEQFKLMRYLELESSIDDPTLESMHIEFHYEILCALDEAIQPLYGTIADRVEYFARRAFLHSRRLESLASHGEASKEAYLGWLEGQDTYIEAIRSLTARRNTIGDEHADSVAIGICYDLTGSEDLALRTLAYALIQAVPAQREDVETSIWRGEGAKNHIVTTPAGDVLGYIRLLPIGFWLATDDVYDRSPEWCRTESDARMHLAHLFLIELPIVTGRGSSSYRVVSRRPLRDPGARRCLSIHRSIWAGSVADGFWLKLWHSHHDLRPGDRIEIRRDSSSDLYWSGRVTDVADQNVYVGETELQHHARRDGHDSAPTNPC